MNTRGHANDDRAHNQRDTLAELDSEEEPGLRRTRVPALMSDVPFDKSPRLSLSLSFLI